MATLQASTILRCKSSITIRATDTNNNAKKTQLSPLSLPSFPSRTWSEDLEIEKHSHSFSTFKTNRTCSTKQSEKLSHKIAAAKLHAIMEAVADRVEMHRNIGAQRDNWNHLLLTSINAITLTAATMAGISAAISGGSGAPSTALKLSSTVLYLAATGMLAVMNKIQPSQLAEEQRNAARLFKQLHYSLSLPNPNPTMFDANEAMEKVLALDKAYPLPLLGKMLQKFPKTVEPAVWWPRQRDRQQADGDHDRKQLGADENGWSREVEEEMREIVGVIERNDVADYLRLSRKALRANRILAVCGPLLTGVGALGSALASCGVGHGAWPGVVGAVAGAMASAVNALQHGGQVGMVFEMYRTNAGFFRLVEETIESNLNEKDAGRRENGLVLEKKVALQLGRSLSELKHLSCCSRNGEATEEFASKLF